MSLAPIALFTYNRLSHTRRTVAALQKNPLAAESDLWIFSDGPKNPEAAPKVRAVREFISGLNGFKSIQIIERSENLGLARSIISGVTELCHKLGKVIVLEDDLVTSPYFLRYANEALDIYENDPEVISVHGYIYPVKEPLPDTFFLKGADCWGWATWKRGWDLFNPDGRELLGQLEARHQTSEFNFNDTFDYVAMLRNQIAGRNDSWAIRWYASAFLRNKLTLYPGKSLVHNIGNDDSGVHSETTDAFDVELSPAPVALQKLPLRENPAGREAVARYFQSLQPPPGGKFWRKLFAPVRRIAGGS